MQMDFQIGKSMFKGTTNYYSAPITKIDRQGTSNRCKASLKVDSAKLCTIHFPVRSGFYEIPFLYEVRALFGTQWRTDSVQWCVNGIQNDQADGEHVSDLWLPSNLITI